MNLMHDGEFHDQEWARLNMSKFHHSIVYIISQCTVCQETWPLKSKPKPKIKVIRHLCVFKMFKG